MNKHDFIRLIAASSVAASGLLLGTGIVSAQTIAWDGFPGSIPKATCGPTDHTESGLAGETSMQERFSGDSQTAYNCNLQLVGQEPQDTYQGAYSQDGPAYYDVCAYYGTDRGPTTGQGIKVIDVSDPAHPVVTANLIDTPAALNPHETVATNASARILVAGQNGGPNFAVYDISDCRHPVLKSSVNVPGSDHHMGAFALDGKTYYSAQNPCCSGTGGPLVVMDLSDPSNARALPTWTFSDDGRPHSLNLNPQGFAGLAAGTRAYMGQGRSWPFSDARDGLVITDVSDYQLRRPNPQIRIVSTMFYYDQGTAESMIPVTINGHPYIITIDEAGAASSNMKGWAGACSRRVSAFGYPNIVDVADERNPRVVSKIRLQISDPANCAGLLATTPPDVPGTAPGTNLPAASGTTNYSVEACVADNPANTKMLACGAQNAGLRVFDVSDPLNPKEIAYWKSAAVRTKVLPAAGSWAAGVDRTVDKIAHWPRWVVAGRASNGNATEVQLWVVTDGHGFQALRFSSSFLAQHQDLFANTVTSESSR